MKVEHIQKICRYTKLFYIQNLICENSVYVQLLYMHIYKRFCICETSLYKHIRFREIKMKCVNS